MSATGEDQKSGPSSVYLNYSSSGELIYVGVTDRGNQRLAEHLAKQPWAWEIQETHWEHYESRTVAENREKSLIIQHYPKYNKVHRRNGEPSKIEYRLRAEQYDLLRRTLMASESLGGELRKAFKNYQLRVEANEKITRYLVRALRDQEPLDEPKLKKINRYLGQSENLAKHRNQKAQAKALRLNPPPVKKRGSAA